MSDTEALVARLADMLAPHLACDGLGCGGGPQDCQDRDFSQDPHKVAAKVVEFLNLSGGVR